MYFGLPDEALALREGLREVLTGACTPSTIRAAWDGSANESLWKELGAFGLFGLLVPEERGGLGLDDLSFVAAMEECGYAGVPGPLVETVAYLPEHDLPLDGSVRLAVQQVGVTHVPYAGVATHVYREDDLTLLSDFAVEPVESVDRSRRVGTVTGESTLDASALGLTPLDELAGTQAPTARERAILGTSAFLLGLARRQLDLTVAYAKERKQFGVPIGSFQAIKHSLANVVVGTEFAWPAVLQAAAGDAGDPHASLRTSAAKAMASDAAYAVSRACLQAHGAIGYTVEYDLHLFAKRTWALANDWGTAAEHRKLIARELS